MSFMISIKFLLKNILKSFIFYTSKLLNCVLLLIKNNKSIVKRAVVPATCALVLLAAVVIWSPLTFAVQIVYNGQSIGYASDKSVFEEACKLIQSKFGTENSEALTLSEPSYTLKVVNSSNVDNADSLCESILKASDGSLVNAYGLYVNSKLVSVADESDKLQNAVDGVLSNYKTEYPDAVFEIKDNIEIKNEYYLADSVSSLSIDNDALDSLLTVAVTRTEVFTDEIAYTTQQITDSSKYLGYSTVSVEGVAGVEQITQKATYINGCEISRDFVSCEVLSEPVTETIVIGSKKYSEATYNGDACFALPVLKSDYTEISAYWGDGRNHHGIDFAAPVGTPIHAVASGTVSFAGWDDSGYGYMIIVDHSDGYQTVYAHCDSMAVTVGQSVTSGEYIGGVGSTGRSTGSHLHFEVRINGTAYNPAPFLGING